MNEIIPVLAALLPLRGAMMKPDKELPAYLRVLRWGVTIFVLAYGILLIAEKLKSIFF